MNYEIHQDGERSVCVIHTSLVSAPVEYTEIVESMFGHPSISSDLAELARMPQADPVGKEALKVYLTACRALRAPKLLVDHAADVVRLVPNGETLMASEEPALHLLQRIGQRHIDVALQAENERRAAEEAERRAIEEQARQLAEAEEHPASDPHFFVENMEQLHEHLTTVEESVAGPDTDPPAAPIDQE